MNSRVFTTALLLAGFTASGCSTFSRSDAEAEKAAEKDGKNIYSANEPAPSTDLKDQKIHHLESTVVNLNSRIQELEGKLQASQIRPDPSTGPETGVKRTGRQSFDGESVAGKIRASIAGNDPGAGYMNDAAVRAFQQGKILFDQEKYPESVLAFSAFLEGNPGHALASSAQYYIGENYYRQGDFAVADEEFQKLTKRYPQSPRVSYALVRLSQSTAMLGKTEEAKRYRIQAEGLFPKSPALKLFRDTPAASAPVTDTAHAATPIATAPDLTIEKPVIPAIKTPSIETTQIESPSVETPTVEAPRVEAPRVEAPRAEPAASVAPRARVSSEDLDGPPGGGG